jgi:enhancer of mRNA-decapping protein 4
VQFWKFAVTGAENNSELKIWSCESWTCLQTIKFTPEVGKKDIVLKAGLDLGAGYLLLSDINYKVKTEAVFLYWVWQRNGQLYNQQ